jgi:hypothetical protein
MIGGHAPSGSSSSPSPPATSSKRRPRRHQLPAGRRPRVPPHAHQGRDREGRQRKADNANKTITGPVRLRDGDECRYCGVIVNWNDRKSNRGGTYDHREGPASPPPSTRSSSPASAATAAAATTPTPTTRYPLRDEPINPVYSDVSAAFILSAGYRVTVTEGLRPGNQPGTAHSDPATSGTTRPPTTTSSTGHPEAPQQRGPRATSICRYRASNIWIARDGSGRVVSLTPHLLPPLDGR